MDPRDTRPPDADPADDSSLSCSAEKARHKGGDAATPVPTDAQQDDRLRTREAAAEKSAASRQLPEYVHSLLKGLVGKLSRADLDQVGAALSLYQSEREARLTARKRGWSLS